MLFLCFLHVQEKLLYKKNVLTEVFIKDMHLDPTIDKFQSDARTLE